MPRAITVCGLHFGDESKGSTVDALVRHTGIRTVVRYSGGSNCAHRVVTDEGDSHVFSSWGSGTLAGASTILTKHVVIDPVRLLNEGQILEKKVGTGHWRGIAIDENALVITPFHQALNRIREINRSTGPHGSCGIGLGEAVRYSLNNPANAVKMKDLLRPITLNDKLETIKSDLLHEARSLTPRYISDDMWRVFHDGNLIDALLWRYSRLIERLTSSTRRIWTTDDILDFVSKYNTIWEGAQGVLLDEDVGFHPYTTWSKTNLTNANAILAQAGVTDVTNVGVLRCYSHRHGPGPFPSEDSSLLPILREPANLTNDWQGPFRVGWFDLPLTRYAIKNAGAPIHYLSLSHLDYLEKQPFWHTVEGYDGISLDDMDNTAPVDLDRREQQSEELIKWCEAEPKWMFGVVSHDYVADYIQDKLQISAGIKSFGESYSKKHIDLTSL